MWLKCETSKYLLKLLKASTKQNTNNSHQSFCSKVYTPVLPFWTSMNACTFCNSYGRVLSVKIWIPKSYSYCWNGFKYAEDAGKKQRRCRTFSVEQTVSLLRTKDSLTFIIKHPGNVTVLRIMRTFQLVNLRFVFMTCA